MLNRENYGAIIVTAAFVILITLGGFLPITTYGQALNDSNPSQAPSADQRTILDGGTTNTSCNCVVFRFDDIQDYYLTDAQVAMMNLFISKNQSLSLGLIMNHIGNDSKIINKVHEGDQKGLFELALHGWNHVDYTKISEQEQKDTLFKANEKMQKLFGHKSQIFIPPYDIFNNNTLKAMGQLGLKIVSAGAHAENVLDQNRSVFIANGEINNNKIKQVIYHLPSTLIFKNHVKGGNWVSRPLATILAAVDNNIKKYGYAVVNLHPVDVAQVNMTAMKDGVKNGDVYMKLLDLNEFNKLSHLIDLLLSQKIHITSFSKIVGIEPISRDSSLK
jgi:peptidoglycan/xylan/chitin deacetylase (PgdA/CDA1 family)